MATATTSTSTTMIALGLAMLLITAPQGMMAVDPNHNKVEVRLVDLTQSERSSRRDATRSNDGGLQVATNNGAVNDDPWVSS